MKFRGVRPAQLWIWIAVAVALRIGAIGAAWMMRGEEAFLQQDSRTYVVLAESMAANFAFERAPGEIEAFRTPGYPLLIALGASLGAPVAVTLAVQLALTATLMMMVCAIVARATANATAGRLAAAAVGFEPTLLLWSTQMMPETLFAAALLAFIGSAQRVFERPTRRWTTLAALSLAAAAYIRPIAYPLVVLVTIAAAISSFFLRSRSGLRSSAWVFVAVCASGLGVWHVRNAVGTGYRGFSTQIDHALYLSGAGAVRARLEGASYAPIRQRMLEAAARLPATAGPGRLSRFEMMREVGWHGVSSEPATFASVHFAGMLRTMFDPGAVEYFRLFGAYPENGGLLGQAVDRGLLHATLELARLRPALWWSTVALAIVTWPYVIFAAWSIGHARARMQPVGLLVTACATYLLIAGGGVPGSSRFRAPAVPLLVLSAAIAPRLQNKTRLTSSGGASRAPLPSSAPDR